MKLALELPGFNNISNPPDLRFSESAAKDSTQLGFIVGEFLALFLYIGFFLMFIWMAWGIFQYIIAQGKKEDLAKARSRIEWALWGFLVLIIAYFVGQYAPTIFPQVRDFTKIKQVSTPPPVTPNPTKGP